MPDKLGRLPEVVGDRVKCIVIAIASGKNNDAKFHGFCFRGGGNFYFTRAAGRLPCGLVTMDAGAAQGEWDNPLRINGPDCGIGQPFAVELRRTGGAREI